MQQANEILELLRPHFAESEAYAVNAQTIKVAYKAGRLRSSEVQETNGVSVRAINDGKLGFYATTDLTDKERLLEATKNSVKYGGEATFEFAPPAQGDIFEGYSSETARMDIQELAELGQRLAAKIEDHTSRDEVTVDVELERVVYEQHLVNSKGVSQKERRSYLSVGVEAQRVRGDDVLMNYNAHIAVAPEDAFEHLAEQIMRLFSQSEKLVKLDTKEGNLPVVFTPTGSILLYYPLLLGLSGKNAHLNVSRLAGKLGEQVFDPRVTFIDEPIVANRPSSTGLDDEGIPTKPINFIDKGVLTGYFYNLKTAGEAKAHSSGHGQRSMLGQPGASFHNPMIMAGDTAFKDLIGDIKEGILVDSVLGMGQTNLLAGIYSNSVNLAFKIENGEIVGRVKDVSIAGNVYDDLRNKLGGISKESELVYGSIRLPYIRLDNISTVSNN